MADDNSKSWTFLKGVGGVAGTVIAAVLIYYFTRPKPTPPPITPPPAIAFEGLVSNLASHAPVPNANVTVAIGPNSVHQKTDLEGRYSVVLNGTGNSADMGTVAITAAGYLPYDNTVAFTSGENFAEIPIEAVPPPPVIGQPPVTVTPIKINPIILKLPPPNFTKKNIVAYQPNFKK